MLRRHDSTVRAISVRATRSVMSFYTGLKQAACGAPPALQTLCQTRFTTLSGLAAGSDDEFA